jgi:uncharacterized protein YjbI with pentapeptide repeats
MCLVLLSVVMLIGVLFEPWQVTRWLLRKAKYERRRKRLLFGQSAGKIWRAIWDTVFSCMPAAIGVLCFALIVLASYGENLLSPPFRNVAIWQKTIHGFRPQANYSSLILAANATIEPGTNLSGSNLKQADMTSVLFPRVRLDGADLSGATLDKAKMLGASLNGANLGMTKSSYVDLSAASLSEDEELNGASFDGAELSDASFWGAHASGASFWGATLFRADFRQADLQGADFSFALLQDTLFDGADLTGADFSLANFTYLSDEQRDALLSQLKRQGAELDGDQQKKAAIWEGKLERTK